MRTSLTRDEIDLTVELLINKYNISSQLIKELLKKYLKDNFEKLYHDLNNVRADKEILCRLLVLKEGVSLFSGSDDGKKKLRERVLDALDDNVIVYLYENNKNESKNIKTPSYMKSYLKKKSWVSGKGWANDFISASGFPKIFVGIGNDKKETRYSVQEIQPLRKVPALAEYQEEIKEKLLEVLKLNGDKTRCMISLPTGGGKTRVAVEAFLDWLQCSFEEEKYMIWIAQSEELCEQCISCIEQMWSSREFILPLRVYRYFSNYDVKEEDLQGGVVVASINKIYDRILSRDRAIEVMLKNTGAMIIDEAHRASTRMYDVLFDKADELTNERLFPICGLSATPGRNTLFENNDLGKLVNRFETNLITPQFKNIEKYINNPLVYFKENKYISKVNHIIFKGATEYKLTDKELHDLKETNEYSQAFLKKLANNNERNLNIINKLLSIKKGQPTLVYACTVDHAKLLSTMMNIQGRKSAYVGSNTNNMQRRILIKEFTEGKIEFLFNFGVLTTGFDAPKTRNIVICRPINSPILYEQIVGRGIRGSRFGGTEECDVIDFSDNILNLGEQKAYLRFSHYWDTEDEE